MVELSWVCCEILRLAYRLTPVLTSYGTCDTLVCLKTRLETPPSAVAMITVCRRHDYRVGDQEGSFNDRIIVTLKCGPVTGIPHLVPTQLLQPVRLTKSPQLTSYGTAGVASSLMSCETMATLPSEKWSCSLSQCRSWRFSLVNRTVPRPANIWHIFFLLPGAYCIENTFISSVRTHHSQKFHFSSRRAAGIQTKCFVTFELMNWRQLKLWYMCSFINMIYPGTCDLQRLGRQHSKNKIHCWWQQRQFAFSRCNCRAYHAMWHSSLLEFSRERERERERDRER